MRGDVWLIFDCVQQQGIHGVGVTFSKNNPAEAAVVVLVTREAQYPAIPAVLDGVRTQVIEGERFSA